MEIKSRVKCDVLIVGAGIAGIRAAVEAAKNGAKVIMVSKGKPGFTGSTFFPNTPLWGPNTVTGKEDQDVFYNEIMNKGHGTAMPELVRIFSENTEKNIEWLNDIGFTNYKCNALPCFGECARGVDPKNTIAGARKLLLNQIKKNNIEVIECVFISDLIIEDTRCSGALGVDRYGDFLLFDSKTVILATGGGESLWKYNSVTEDIEGNGYSLLLKEGARCCNLEFIQFIPAFTHPFNKMHLVQSIIEKGAILQNKRGESVLGKYLPDGITESECLEERAKHGPFSCEYISRFFDIALHEESATGCGFDSGGLRLVVPQEIYGYSYDYIDWLREKGMDIFSDDMILYPHCQGFNGGGIIDLNAKTDFENLYACGEAAGGMHGADRIGGNAISAALVFGEIAGREAAKMAKGITSKNSLSADPNGILSALIEKNYASRNASSKISPWDVKKEIKEVMSSSAGIVRKGENICKGKELLRELYESFDVLFWMGKGCTRKALEAANCIITAEGVLSAISMRNESRGPHYRKDYPEKNDKFSQWSITKWDRIKGGITGI